VLAVVLDQQKKYADADGLYRRAIALTPRSAPLLNNYGNHLLATGKLDAARGVFLKVLAIDATHANALLQLSRLAVERKAPAEALQYLDRLPAAARQQRDVEITRMQALFGVRRDGEAEELLDRLSKKAGSDPQDNFALGAALAAAGKYDKAEERFSRALEAAPDNFDVLYRLGLAASHAGHNERARDILQSAHQRQPENVDVLYDLAAVNAKLGQQETAVQLLAEAARLAPDRPDVQQLLARTTADLGYFGDALRAWDRYLKLVPKDDVARRERAFAASAMGEDMDRALADLKDYAARHASDPVGHYELGIAEASVAPEDAVRQFDRALALRPELTAARIARGLVLFKQGSFATALPDFEAAAKQEPNNAVVLDRLGQTYMALDRSADAVPILRKAAELAPRDSKTLMHLGRALTNTGQEDEAKTIFARFRELGADQSALPHPAGLVDFLSLSSQEQMARYRAGVERTVKSDPRNPEAQVRYLKLLLDDGKTAEASTVAHRILELGPSAELLADAGNAMLAAEQYGLAKELLQKAASSDPAVTLNLAIAVAHAENPRAGLEQLDRVPPAQRSGDYYLARAQMLDASGRADDAIAALRQALHANPTRADLYRQAAAFLMQRNQPAEALAVLERGVTATHGNPDVLLMRVIALEASGKPHDAEQGLKTLGDRWPDWYNVWLARAIFAAWQGRDDEARQMLQTAAALGAAGAGQRFSAATGGAAGSDNAARAARLLQALFP
jgi:tetratricopeptide (TPR) repeat protein